MPGLLKIGMTSRTPNHRKRELSSSTGVPTPFRVIFYAKTNDCALAEERVHHILRRRRVNPNREFFKVTPDQAKSTIQRVASSRIIRHKSNFFAWVMIALIGVITWAFLRWGLIAYAGIHQYRYFYNEFSRLFGHHIGQYFPEVLTLCVVLLLVGLLYFPSRKRNVRYRRRRK